MTEPYEDTGATVMATIGEASGSRAIERPDSLSQFADPLTISEATPTLYGHGDGPDQLISAASKAKEKRMKIAARAGWVVVAVCCGVLALPGSALAITNGTVDGTAHPNVGALTINYQGRQILGCTGTLISPTVMVTQGLCLAITQQLGFSQVDVSFAPDIGSGSDITCAVFDCYVSPPSDSLHVGTIYIDPLFTGSVTPSDRDNLGVVVLDNPVQGITPASLPSAGILDNMAAAGTLASQTFPIVGYGLNTVVGANGHTVGLFDGQRRYATSGDPSINPDDLRLNGNPNAGFGGPCIHDPGGPAFLGNSDVVVAIDGGGGAATCDGVTWDPRLDTASARSFLANYVTLP
jgi:hypothetical protein